jgi:hypothetical protein
MEPKNSSPARERQRRFGSFRRYLSPTSSFLPHSDGQVSIVPVTYEVSEHDSERSQGL